MLRTTTLVAALILGGCSHIKYLFVEPENPRVEFTEFRIDEATLTKITAEIRLLVHNPNDFPISGRAINYQVFFKDQKLATGAYEDVLSIKAQSKAKVSIPIKVSTFSAIEVGKAYLTKSKPVKLRIKGSGAFDTPLGELDLQFNKTRTIN